MSGDSGDRSSAFASESVPDEYERHLVPTVFSPWAEVLLDAVVVAPGSRVLDIASGTGALARAAGQRAGGDGHVVASDLSGPMLGRAAAVEAPEGAAPIEYVEASADALPFADGRFDVVLCQQGLQFFPRQAAAVREMRRVLHPGGVAGIAVWAAGHPLEPFGVYGEELAAIGAQAPFARAFESDTFTMSVETVRSLLEDAGFSPIDASVVELEVSWPDAASVAVGVLGTPFGPLVHTLSGDLRRKFEAALEKRFTPDEPGAPVHRRTAAVIARATVA
ncbi:MAG TPA: methyltransferase domain-containing protein [Solirubrobacteraceae bacterium]|nr:methyltransferase domain-containing protein [Solirubrobacteraceae bacterium]